MNEELIRKETFKINRKKNYLFFLRAYDEFSGTSLDKEDITFKYHTKDEKLKQFYDKYEIGEQIRNCNNELEIFINLLEWIQVLCKNSFPVIHERYLDPWEIACRLKTGTNMNCISYATLLNAVLLSCGFYSRNIWCFPMDISEIEGHVVTCVFSKEYKKWVFLDASNGICCVDESGIPYDLMQFRNAIMYGDRIRIVHTSNWLPKFQAFSQERYLIYMSKNLFRFKCYNISNFDDEADLNNKQIICLNPSKYFPISGKGWKRVNNRNICQIYTDNSQIFWKKPF